MGWTIDVICPEQFTPVLGHPTNICHIKYNLIFRFINYVYATTYS